ncbi:hypothetical protein [Mariniblastus fucicola]|uniref:Uncharacterized protein n=1 Tax=Mariniblastus fucicola TaxID=980251 RepID=A0A5B9PDX6_9BACT|nr:hypothetical protein [Mariniblastus fucicola]QEG24907.1 hypothetical protein MFFC18_48300 [Mariniblastus fucicola]
MHDLDLNKKPIVTTAEHVISFSPGMTIKLRLNGRRLKDITQIDIVGRRGQDQSPAIRVAPEDTIQISQDELIITFTIPENGFWKKEPEIDESEELEITVTTNEGDDSTIYP